MCDEMTAAGVFVFSDGALDASTVVCSVDPSSGTPLFTDGPFVETKEHLGGFAVVDVADDAAARYWAGRIAMAVGWPQEVHRFPHRAGVLADAPVRGRFYRAVRKGLARLAHRTSLKTVRSPGWRTHARS